MAKQARLEDLYVTGKEETFVDGQRSVTVWIQPINTPEHEVAVRKASARRATTLMLRHDDTSEGYLEVRDQVEMLGDGYVIEYLVADESYKCEAAAAAEEEAEEEWSKDGYLQSLKDAWEPGDEEVGLKDVYALGASDPDHGDRYPEAERVLDEMKRFNAAVADRLIPIVEQIRQGLASEDPVELRSRCTKRFIEAAGNAVWKEEYERCEVWLGTRCSDAHNERYYAERSAIDRLPDEVYARLRHAHDNIAVDVVTGKGSQQAPSSSPSSEPSTEAATGQSSGLASVPG